MDAAWAVAGGALGLVMVQTARLSWRAGLPGRRIRLKARRAQAGEDRAIDVLDRHGYAIVARQPTARWPVTAGATEWEVLVRADYLVRRSGRTLVAEVKTGDEAPTIASRATRRQLLEYLCAFEADGVLLVDAEAGTVDEITFALPVRGVTRLFPLVLAFLLGAILTLAGTWPGTRPASPDRPPARRTAAR